MIRSAYIGLLLLGLAACSEQQSWNKFEGLEYKGELNDCQDDAVNYYLLDLHLKNETDSSIINTYKLGRKLEVAKGSMDGTSGLARLIARMCPGDSLDLKLPLDSIYLALGGQRPAGLEAGQGKMSLVLSDALTEIKYDAHKRVFEKQSMERYVNRFRWAVEYDSVSGVYYEYLKHSRSSAVEYSKAEIAYVIKGLNDELIEYSKDGEPLIYDRSDGALLKGMHVVASKLQKGDKIRAILPSSMAYGKKGKGRIPAFYPLVIEMELLEIIE